MGAHPGSPRSLGGCSVKVTVGTFNLNNLFSCFKFAGGKVTYLKRHSRDVVRALMEIAKTQIVEIIVENLFSMKNQTLESGQMYCSVASEQFL